MWEIIRKICLSKPFMIIAFVLLQAVSIKVIKDKDNKIASLSNNVESYVNVINGNKLHNNTLQLSVADLRTSNDSLIKQAEQYRKKLKVAQKGLKQVSAVSIEVKEHVQKVIPNNPVDKPIINFKDTLRINDLTTVIVNKQDSLLSVKLHISTDMFLYISKTRVYRNRYSNFISRLFHFDFKKDTRNEYKITASNPIIKIKDIRVIDIK